MADWVDTGGSWGIAGVFALGGATLQLYNIKKKIYNIIINQNFNFTL